MSRKNNLLNLMSPTETRTEEGFALLWDPPEDQTNTKRYRIYLDGKAIGTTEDTDYTFRGLAASRTYRAYVCGEGKDDGSASGGTSGSALEVTTKRKPEKFDITAFGAVGGGKTLNTQAIQRAIDACSAGGCVRIPRGVFLTGPIYLKSDMTLYLEKGAKLLGSRNLRDYPLEYYRFEGLETDCYASLISTRDTGIRLKNITIAGPGTIDASGSPLRAKEIKENKGKPGRTICLRKVDGVYLKDITVRQSPAWCVHLIYCDGVSLNNVKIFTKYDENGVPYANMGNGDGFDPDSCRNVSVFHCMIASQDDCIAIKSGRDEEGRKIGIPSENIKIINCTFRSGFGVAVGSEMAGGVRNVLVRDCRFNDVYSAVAIKAPRGRGGVVENIRFENIVHKNSSNEQKDCKWFRGAIYIDQFYSHEFFDVKQPEPVTESTPIIRNILLKNISVDTISGNAIYISGLPECPLDNICLENIHARGKYGMKIFNVSRLELKDVSVETYTR